MSEYIAIVISILGVVGLILSVLICLGIIYVCYKVEKSFNELMIKLEEPTIVTIEQDYHTRVEDFDYE